ncbi:hypothetical protein SFRURICE_000953 [Spodoptera frugiperda]|nr:hypothetical protein SFRURICE_000953 [Spodoptera frugiperda]
MSDIKSLIKKRASIKAKLTQFSSYLNVAKSCEQLSEVQIVEVEYRLNIFENLYDKYDMLQTDIEETVDDPSEQYAEREEFEKQYYTLVAAARQLISTLVNVSDAEGNLHTARVLLDNGSTANLISKDLARKLNISTYTVESKVRGINDQSSYCTQGCSISFNSINSEYEIDIDCYVMPKISSSVPNTYIDAHNISIPTNIVLADPQFYVPSSIDILVGAEVFWNVIGTNRIELGKSMPTLFESKLGWLLSGN